jgi:3-oxoacyl-[acyl-carrier-protein] synthase II
MAEKIVITGLSAVSSCGVGFDSLKAGIAKDSAPVMVEQFEMQKTPREMAAFQLTDDQFDPKEILGRKGLRTKDKAAKMLLSTIEIEWKEYLDGLEDIEKPGLVVGTSFGSIESIGNFLSVSIESGVGSVNPNLFGNTVINSPTGNANIRFGLTNLSATMSTGFNAGLDAFIYSCDQIKMGYYKSLFTGGLEELSAYALIGMERDGCLSTTNSAKPFGKDADGYLGGEGCAIALVETEEVANARGATILAEIAGYASGFEPNGGKLGFNSEAEVATEVIKMAIADAGITADDIDFVASDANGSKAGDAMRAKAIVSVLGNTPVTAYRSKLGESYGAAGALDVAAVIADMQDGRVSAVNGSYDVVDGVNLVRENLDLNSTYALITSFSSDGNCSAVVLKKS